MNWIIVANRIQARIFKARPFTLIKTLEDPLGREKNRAMTTDKPGVGRAKFAGPSSPHAMTGEKDPHEDAAVQFARVIGRFLKSASNAHRFENLRIIAEPKMIGRLRSFLEPRLEQKVAWVRKDLGHLSTHELKLALGLREKRHPF